MLRARQLLVASIISTAAGYGFAANAPDIFQGTWVLGYSNASLCPPEQYDNQTRLGGQASWRVECNWQPSSTNAYRNERALKDPKLTYGRDHWMGFAVYFPSEHWSQPSTPKGNYTSIFFQLHGSPDKDAQGTRIEPYRNPPVALQVVDRQGTISLSILGDTRAVSPNKNQFERRIVHTVASSVPMDRWVAFVVHYRPHHDISKAPRTRLWMDGNLVVDDRGINTFNDTNAPVVKHGLYIPGWKRDWSSEGLTPPGRTKIMYSSGFKIGDSMAEVDPRSGQAESADPAPPVLIIGP